MSTSTDGFGVWNGIGTITPVINQWVRFPNQANGGLNDIRLTFFYDETQYKLLNSYGLLRAVYKTEGKELVTKPLRIYVSSEILTLEIPISNEFRLRDIVFRDFEIKKRPYYNPKWKIQDLNWSVRLEELWG